MKSVTFIGFLAIMMTAIFIISFFLTASYAKADFVREMGRNGLEATKIWVMLLAVGAYMKEKGL